MKYSKLPVEIPHQIVKLKERGLKFNNEIKAQSYLSNISYYRLRAYANYIQEKGESQQATQNKNKAFDDLSKWVSEFYSVAKIALDDNPQLLESVSKLVRS